MGGGGINPSSGNSPTQTLTPISSDLTDTQTYPPHLVNPLTLPVPLPDTIYVTAPFPLNGNIKPLSLQDYMDCYPDADTAESTYRNHSKRMTLDNPHGFVQSAIIELRGIVDYRVYCRAVRRKLSQRHYKNVCSCPERTALMNTFLNRPYYPPSVRIQQIYDLPDESDDMESLH